MILSRDGVATIGQHGEHGRLGNLFVRDDKHEDIDVRAAELPVCLVNGQHFLPVAGQEHVQKSGDEVEVEFRQKTLDSLQTWIRLGEGVEIVCQYAVSYGFNLAQSDFKQANQADVRLVDLFREKTLIVSKISLFLQP